jgi:hypothetical protein
MVLTDQFTQRENRDVCTELIRAANHGEFVERSTMTLGEWLADWLEMSVKPSKRPNTYATYKRIVGSVPSSGVNRARLP